MPSSSHRSRERLRYLVRTALATTVVVALAGAFAPGASAAPLTPERYAGLDAVYQALDALDGGARDLAAALAPARAACVKLDRSDRLLGPARAQCQSLFKLILTKNPTCANRTRCLTQFRAVRRLTEKLIADTRALNTAIASTVTTQRCRTFLRSDAKEIMGFERLVTAYERVESALVARSAPRLRSALRKLEAVPAPGAGSDDTSEREFRKECASAP